MKVLQLCCFTSLWPKDWQVESIDLKQGKDVMELDLDIGKNYDLIASSPPCTQFTRASAYMWEFYPKKDIELVRKCLEISERSGKYWFLENPPGRIESLIPELNRYRLLTWTGSETNKEYVIYGNFIILKSGEPRYGKVVIERDKLQREKWIPQLIYDITKCLT